MLGFSLFLDKLGFDPATTKLLRHDLNGLAAWRRGHEAFSCFASFQSRKVNPYSTSTQVCHFLPGPVLSDGRQSALYVGTTRIVDRWNWDSLRLPHQVDPIILESVKSAEGLEAYDLEWITSAAPWSERLLIEWGTGARAWHQWADRQPKQILEWRMTSQEPPFPGFSAFISRISELPGFPISWHAALGSVRGIYLLVTNDGQQYVGSAYGADGFTGRWRTYLTNGHGNNVRLREGGHRDYTVSILEVASPDMSASDIIEREGFWKNRLGARAYGLNAN